MIFSGFCHKCSTMSCKYARCDFRRASKNPLPVARKAGNFLVNGLKSLMSAVLPATFVGVEAQVFTIVVTGCEWWR